jgi:hypothetical protein
MKVMVIIIATTVLFNRGDRYPEDIHEYDTHHRSIHHSYMVINGTLTLSFYENMRCGDPPPYRKRMRLRWGE